MMKTASLILLLLTLSIGINAQNIVLAEYYIDNDPGYGNATSVPLSAAKDITLDFNADLSNVDIGFHFIAIRVKDNNDNWSHILNSPFTVFSLANDDKNKIIKAEYFIDVDPGFDNAIEIPTDINKDITTSFVGDLSNLNCGFHFISIRAKDEFGNWSQILTNPFCIFSLKESNKIEQLEYFIDSDPGFGQATQVKISNPAYDVTQDFIVDLSEYQYGEKHILYVRAKDESGMWSNILTQEFKRNVGIYVASEPSAGGTINIENGTFELNKDVELIATPNKGYSFVNWTEAGIQISTDSIYDFIAIEDRHLTANFAKITLVDEIENKMFSIYPNPACDYINILVKSTIQNFNNVQIRIIDNSGKIYKTTELENQQDFIQFSVSELNSGIYFIQIFNKQTQVLRSKMIINKN